jgi:TRAP-type C4-dicarboxylate transport system permease small subunit
MLKGLLAQGQPDIYLGVPAGSGFENLTSLSFAAIIEYAINIILVLAAVLFFFLMVLGGIRWITSGGDKGQTEAARAQITAAFVGLVIVFAAWAIMEIVGTFFNVNLTGGFDINP